MGRAKDIIVKTLVKNTKWNGFIELNRLAFDNELPKNSESRCISIAIKLIKKNAPHIKWIISFADGTQCGDGTIYRASGFKLIGIKKNNQLRINPNTNTSMQTMTAFHKGLIKKFVTWKKLIGYQFRYIYLIDKICKITVPILSFSMIEQIGAGMYKGIKRSKQAMAVTIGTAEGQHLPGRSNNAIDLKQTVLEKNINEAANETDFL